MPPTNKKSRKISKTSIMALAAVGIIGLAGAGGVVSAATNNRDDGLAERIASKFNLSKDEVSEEIGSYRQEREAARESEMKQKMSDSLQAKVDEGKLTSEQKIALEAKLDELHTKHKEARDSKTDEDKSKTREEREAGRQAERDELKTWAKEQGIENLDEILPKLEDGERRHGGRRD